MNQYPLLLQNLWHGFPIGKMPRLESTVIIPNHSSVYQNLDVVIDYINTEVSANHMSGPFSYQEMERILQGPFYASPLIVSMNDQGPDLPPKCRVCHNLSKGDRVSRMPSVNSFIDKKDFLTWFDKVFWVADTVSLSSSVIRSVFKLAQHVIWIQIKLLHLYSFKFLGLSFPPNTCLYVIKFNGIKISGL